MVQKGSDPNCTEGTLKKLRSCTINADLHFYRNSARISMHFIGIQKGFLCILSEFSEDFYALYRNSGFYHYLSGWN